MKYLILIIALLTVSGCDTTRADSTGQAITHTDERTVESPQADGSKIIVKTVDTHQATSSSTQNSVTIPPAVASGAAGLLGMLGPYGTLISTLIGAGGTVLAYAKSKEAASHKADADEAWDTIKSQATNAVPMTTVAVAK